MRVLIKSPEKTAGNALAFKASALPALKIKEPKTIVYLTRWSDRIIHPNYLKTIAQSEEWAGRLTIAYHGSRSLSSEERPPAPSPGISLPEIEVINFSNLTGGQVFSKLVRECLIHGLSQNAEIIGLIDDDAFHSSPQRLLSHAQSLIHGRMHGCTGPIAQYRQMARYKNELPDLGFHPIQAWPWTTYGCQFYNCQFLAQAYPIWSRHLPHLFLRSDAFLFMLADSLEYVLSEFFIPGYSHRCSKSLAKPGQFDMASIIRRAAISTLDCEGMLAGLPHAYADQIQHIQSEDVKVLRAEFKRMGLTCPFRNWQEMKSWMLNHKESIKFFPEAFDETPIPLDPLKSQDSQGDNQW